MSTFLRGTTIARFAGCTSSAVGEKAVGSDEPHAMDEHARVAKFDKLWSDGELTLFRLHEEASGTSLLLRATEREPSQAAADRLETAYALRSELASEWAIVPRARGPDHDSSMVHDDPGGSLLLTVLEHNLDAVISLDLAIALTGAVASMHERGIVHRDLKPSNVWVDLSTRQVWLTGFGFASHMAQDGSTPQLHEGVVGTLPYMAPEQTGRMNRAVDSRADLYSLGVVLYEMLSGRLPFAASTPRQWVHSHVARKPNPLPETVPRGLSAIVEKLLVKSIDQRYQTAGGLYADLTYARQLLRADGDVPPFLLGQQDVTRRLHLPDKAHGRRAELTLLSSALERVTKTGKPELVLVTGASGVGKSALIAELRRSIAPVAGSYCAGKYDQFLRNTPYATIARALTDLVHQQLRKTDSELARIRTELARALRPYARLAYNVVPDLELLLGPQPPLPELSAAEEKLRVLQLLSAALTAFARTAGSLTLFLDDLHWADPATLELLRHFFECGETCHVLIIGAYRDNELHREPLLALTLDAIRGYGSFITDVPLGPLAPVHCADMLTEMLRVDGTDMLPLWALVHEKTGGNPFFAIHFVGTLLDGGLLSFDATERCWRWDVVQIHGRASTDNVAELLIAKLARLPESLREALVVLACLGRASTVPILAQLLDVAESELAVLFAPAARLNMIVHTAGGYRFAHDRIQEASHLLVSADIRATWHLKIARLLLQHSQGRGDELFDIASHFNDAGALVVTLAECQVAAQVNLGAAAHARSAGAYAAATAYVTNARRLLGDNAWQTSPELITQVELVHAQCEHLDGQLVRAAARLATAVTLVREPVALAEIARTRGEVLYALGQVPEAIAACVEFLHGVGIDWPTKPTLADARTEYLTLLTRLGGRPMRTLGSLPDMTDPLLRAYSSVLLAMVSPTSVLVDRSSFAMTVLRIINLGIEHGLMPAATLALARGAEALISMFDDWERGLDSASLAMELAEREDFSAQRGRVLSAISVNVQHWMCSLAECRTTLARARHLTREAGDVTFHAIAIIYELQFGIALGEPLAALAHEARTSHDILVKTHFTMMSLCTLAEVRFIQMLLGDPVTEADPVALAHPGNRMGFLHIRARDVLAAVYFGDDARAVALLPDAEPVSILAPTRMVTLELYFSAALAYAGVGDAPSAHRYGERYLKWARRSTNFAARCLLVEAELAALADRCEDAGRLYDEAVTAAHGAGSLNIVGLASERAERWYRRRGLPTAAHSYREEAARAWRRWGAHVKLESPRAPTKLARDEGMTRLSVARVAAMAQTVAREIELDRLAETVLALALAEGLASRGQVVMTEGAQLVSLAVARLGVAQAKRGPYLGAERHIRRAEETREVVLENEERIIVLPFVNQGRMVGALVLESDQPFVPERVAVLAVLAGLSAIALEHARLYAELREAEAHRAEAERLSRTGSFGWKPETGESTWSEEALAIHGYPPDTHAGISLLLERVHPDDRDRVLRDMEHMDRAGEWASAHRLLLPSGEVRYVQVHTRCLAGEHESPEFAGAVVDLTSTKMLEENLKASHRQFEVILSSIGDGVVVADETGRVTFLNRTAEELTGWSCADAVGQLYTDVVAIADATLGGKDGRRVPIEERCSSLLDDAGVLRGKVSVISDASELLEAGRAEILASTNERLELALRGSNVGIWEIPLESGRLPVGLGVRSVNVWASLGWVPDVGQMSRPHPERVHPESLQQLVRAWQGHLDGDLPSVDAEVRFLHSDGNYRWMLHRGSLKRNADGEPVLLAGTSVNITDRREMESALRRARDAAEAADRAKDEFLANVSHEIRTPMNTILGMTELTLSTQLSSEQRSWLATVKSSADNLLVIIDELLDYSKAAANQLELAVEQLSVRALLAETLRALALRAHRKSILLVGDVDDEVPELLLGDPTRLRQILTNLVGNAVKFTHRGEVSIAISLGSTTDSIGAELVIAVRDTGIGIDKDKQAVVFEPFAQEDTSTTRRFGGTGLGLTIASRLAAMMQGRISLVSEPGAGSTFTAHVRLGVYPGVTVAPRQRLAPGVRILILDDNQVMRETLERWSRSIGAASVAVPDLATGMQIFEEAGRTGRPFPLVLLATNLDDIERTLLPWRLGKTGALAPSRFVAMSRIGEPFRENWVDAKLQKPFTRDEFASTVRRLLEPSLHVPIGQAVLTATLPRGATPSLRVLVGEDNEFNADLAREMLMHRGHRVVVFGDGHAVLAQAISDNFDLLLLDLHMPGMDGFAVARAIREREKLTGRHLPIIALTARSQREARERCLQAGMDAFLGKPLQGRLLFETIERSTRGR